MHTVPVTLEALEASWVPVVRDEPVWHGTRASVVDKIVAEGIRPMGRTHVHLAGELDSRVGKRANVDVMLAVDPKQLDGLWVSPNGVFLARMVPGTAIVDLVAMTRAAQSCEDELRSLLRSGTRTAATAASRA